METDQAFGRTCIIAVPVPGPARQPTQVMSVSSKTTVDAVICRCAKAYPWCLKLAHATDAMLSSSMRIRA